VTQASGTPLSPSAEPHDRGGSAADAADASTTAPFALIIDDQEALCRTIAIVLAGIGVESASHHTAQAAIAALDQRRPDIIFLDMVLEQSDAIDVIKGLGEKRYTGIVQLMSGGKLPLLEAVQRLGARFGLLLRPPLQKPFRAAAIREAIVSSGLACTVPPSPI
jgi:DNA-binding NtrC family response regulator